MRQIKYLEILNEASRVDKELNKLRKSNPEKARNMMSKLTVHANKSILNNNIYTKKDEGKKFMVDKPLNYNKIHFAANDKFNESFFNDFKKSYRERLKAIPENPTISSIPKEEFNQRFADRRFIMNNNKVNKLYDMGYLNKDAYDKVLKVKNSENLKNHVPETYDNPNKFSQKEELNYPDKNNKGYTISYQGKNSFDFFMNKNKEFYSNVPLFNKGERQAVIHPPGTIYTSVFDNKDSYKEELRSLKDSDGGSWYAMRTGEYGDEPIQIKGKIKGKHIITPPNAEAPTEGLLDRDTIQNLINKNKIKVKDYKNPNVYDYNQYDDSYPEHVNPKYNVIRAKLDPDSFNDISNENGTYRYIVSPNYTYTKHFKGKG